MKHLTESILSGTRKVIVNDDIEQMKAVFNIKGKVTVHDNIVDVDGSVHVRGISNEDLTFRGYRFGEVTEFVVMGARNLKSLNGAPKKVDSFLCSRCPKLENFEGAPQDVRFEIGCVDCDNFKSLKGLSDNTPRLTCKGCHNIKSLQYCPSKLKVLCLRDMKGLKDLTGLPKHLESLDVKDNPQFDEKLWIKLLRTLDDDSVLHSESSSLDIYTYELIEKYKKRRHFSWF